MKAAGEEGMDGASAFEAYVHRAFAPDGLFSRARDFEYRAEQQSMALAVARALQVDAPLLVEAGTGVGKSLGYLLPAVKFALDFDRKAVVSTHTINLQEQLFNKDIPLLRTALGIDFSAALLKGRQNYLCHTRLRRALAQMDSLFTQGEAAELKRIQDWALRTQDGTLSDMAFRPSSKVWAMVCSEPHACSMRHCGPSCPYQAARKRVLEAKVVVLNHTLFFGLMAQAEDSEEAGFVFPGDFVILDEAHMIENIAARQLGVQLSEPHLNYELLRMYNPRTHKGLLKPLNNPALFQRVQDVMDASGLFFQNARDDLGFAGSGKIVRILQPEWSQDILSQPLMELIGELKTEREKQEENAAAKEELADMAARMEEAHMIENIAARQLGVQLSEPHLNYELLRMYNPRTHKGLLKPLNNPALFQRVQDVMDASGLFFQNARDDLGFAGSGKIVRILQPEWSQDILSQPLMELIGELKTEREKQEENAAAKEELADMAARMEEAQASLKALMDMTEEGHVYWAERSGPDGRNMCICSAPVEVGDILRERLFSAGRSAILTSATLGTGDADMSYFAGRVGAESVRKLQIGSPFNYREQMRLIVARSMPEPDQPEYAEVLPEWIKRYLAESRGRAFVLFTSYRLMVQAAEKVRPFCEEQGWTLYVQGQDMQRHAMLEAFRKDVDSVLFGTDSFWTGVDVPGESLSNVIVTRLPFEVPDHPLVESRFESIRERGGNPFYEYSVPVAILKLRQGVGRLIRTRSDSGMVVILDPRVATKRYGMRFLKSLPEARLEFV